MDFSGERAAIAAHQVVWFWTSLEQSSWEGWWQEDSDIFPMSWAWRWTPKAGWSLIAWPVL